MAGKIGKYMLRAFHCAPEIVDPRAGLRLPQSLRVVGFSDAPIQRFDSTIAVTA